MPPVPALKTASTSASVSPASSKASRAATPCMPSTVMSGTSPRGLSATPTMAAFPLNSCATPRNVSSLGAMRRAGLLVFLMVAACSASAVSTTTVTATVTTTKPVITSTTAALAAEGPGIKEFAVPPGSHPHDVGPAPDGTVWYTAQAAGALGRLGPATGRTHHIDLGSGSAPHGVIVGPDGAAWVTDGGLNAIVRVDHSSEAITVFPLPAARPGANLNTAAFDKTGRLWFTGQRGVYGRLDPATGAIEVFDAPLGPRPYGLTVTPHGTIWYASPAG